MFNPLPAVADQLLEYRLVHPGRQPVPAVPWLA
jgi:hypothetical protein